MTEDYKSESDSATITVRLQTEPQQTYDHVISTDTLEVFSDDFYRKIDEAVRAARPKRKPLKLVKKKFTRPKPPLFTIEQILVWADAHHAATGTWPKKTSGAIHGTDGEKWSKVESALKQGNRGLSGSSTITQLLAEYRNIRHRLRLPDLTLSIILQWADSHHSRTGKWPNHKSGAIFDAPEETWSGINASLSRGYRSLPGGATLADLLTQHRGIRNKKKLPPLHESQILQWADAYRERTGTWPTYDSGSIEETQWDTWRSVDIALVAGNRRLPGGSSLARLFSEQRQAPYQHDKEPFSVPQILKWADAWHCLHGTWPLLTSGPVLDGADTTWTAVHVALQKGLRGLPGGSSLPRLLAQHRGVSNRKALAPFTQEHILAWADRHKERSGRWPTSKSGSITDAPDETWAAVNVALFAGCRGLSGGSSLAALLAEERGRRDNMRAPQLTESQILQWADACHAREGKWPNANSGPISGETGETWSAVNAALSTGGRGLAGGSSLAKLLHAQRGVRNRNAQPPLTEAQILSGILSST